jgi:hypothetical protein
MPELNDHFYTQLIPQKMALHKLLGNEELFYSLPQDWHVIVTDIKNSTGAVFSGQHEMVNFVATGSIVAVLNIAYAMKVEIPFFFGGDGASFIVPPALVGKVMRALALYKEHTQTNFGLEIRAGIIPVEAIYKNGHQLNITKYSSSDIFSIPVLLGTGLSYAEKLIKHPDYLTQAYEEPEAELNLTGMQCRWDKIAPPDKQEEVVTLLVLSTSSNMHSKTFAKVVNKIDEIYGPPNNRTPISINKLRIKTTYTRIKTEVLMQFEKFYMVKVLQRATNSFLAYIYFKTKQGKGYLERLVAMSDTLVIDGKINTVISGTQAQRKELQQFLDQLETANEIIYGLHVSKASVMSCYVRDLKDGHIHFVDGAEGGYTQAAAVIKKKIASKKLE